MNYKDTAIKCLYGISTFGNTILKSFYCISGFGNSCLLISKAIKSC